MYISAKEDGFVRADCLGCRAPNNREKFWIKPATDNRLTLGLHLDTNNQRDRRWVTFIVYLTTVKPEAGGHTVFPLATRGVREPNKEDLDMFLGAAGKLMQHGFR